MRITQSWELLRIMRIIKNHENHPRIMKKYFLRIMWIACWESWELLIENHWELLSNHENYTKTICKVLPLQWSTTKWHTYLQHHFTYTFGLAYEYGTTFQWFLWFLWFYESWSFSHLVKTTGVDHINMCRMNYLCYLYLCV